MTTLRNELPTSPATGGLRRLVSDRVNFAYMYAAMKCSKQKESKMADALRLQLNVRQNAEELQDILQDLNKWEDEVKAKDNDLRSSRIINKKV